MNPSARGPLGLAAVQVHTCWFDDLFSSLASSSSSISSSSSGASKSSTSPSIGGRVRKATEKPHRILQISSPTIRALDSADLKDIDVDSSWGEISSVQLEEQDDGTLYCTRERPATRHDNLKASGRELRRETKTLQAKVAELERQRSEGPHSIDRPKLAHEENPAREGGTGRASEKSTLKRRGVSYITELITFDIEDFKETHLPLSKTSQTFIATINKALVLLAPQELAFCKELEAQLKEVSPRPVCAAASKVACLHSPIPSVCGRTTTRTRQTGPSSPTAGSSNEPDILKKEIAKLEEELKKLRAELAEQGGDADRGADP
ncbi:hypothetical protein B0H14DRAFT_3136866 [Mycena olivaceomarginata]|nr:hypothetical protein B0H14DRAFT_3136866 [Mycena olivaceomarginata]